MTTSPESPSAADETDLLVRIARLRFALRSDATPPTEKAKSKAEAIALADREGLSGVYRSLHEEFGWAPDASRQAALDAATKDELAKLEERITDAIDNLGDTEVREALAAKAQLLLRVGAPREERAKWFKAAEEKTVAVGHNLDMLFSQLIGAIFDGDLGDMKALIDRCKALLEKGGDWERKNKLKVYEGCYLMATRKFKEAGDLLLSSVATFTTTELFPYQTLVLYTVVTSIVTLDRVDLKKKVVDAPEILTVISGLPSLEALLNALYGCRYADFFAALPDVADVVKRDMFLAPHHRYFLREIRKRIYSQFLESYKSVSLEGMASTFGVSPEFLDRELCGFIVSGDLDAKIDKIDNIVETVRTDGRETLFTEVIRKGDGLLNKIQKLESKIIE